MKKLDLTQKDKSYFTAKNHPEIVQIEKAAFISIPGKGDPSGAHFAQNIEALYATAYHVKFAFKAKSMDFVVSKLEGLWWYDETKFPGRTMGSAAIDIPRSEWEYRLLIRMPDFITSADIEPAKVVVADRKQMPKVKEIEWFEMAEGKCVQVLHVGPFSTEPETLKAMSDFINDHQFAKNGLHHEIYLSDFRKTAPEKLKTILREPIR